ncbi:ATP-binding protein [Halobacteriovorax sp. GB3]|uniref:sensor histidine kinase n=1 Tax=Halobacteriovorax sp. GB3 TaxID=2719615 RepID=UPI002360F5CD|nr:ATP-binding protein [Halobacteriovorax sp. GB3]MDD0851943.1 ATP-binding protein [Halobacteriovorax sp. GB3]
MNKRSIMDNPKQFKSLSFKVLVWILLTSSFLTTLFTCFSLYLDYRNEMNLMDLTIEQVRKSTVSSLGRSLWDINLEQVQAQVDGIMKINDVVAVVVYDEKGEKLIEEAKKYKTTFATKTRFNLTHLTSEGEKNLGELLIVLTQENLFDRLKTKVIFIFLTQGLKTLTISFIIILIINKFILGYLVKLSLFFKNYDLNSMEITELPDRGNPPDYYDELDMLHDSIEKMNVVVGEYNKKMREDIEKKDVELQKQKAYAENASRLASLGEMAGGIAHEINNPLMIISSSSDLIKRSLKNDQPDLDKIEAMNEKIKNTVRRVVEVIQGLKRIARNAESDTLNPTFVNEIVSNVTALCTEKFKSSGVQFDLDISNKQLQERVLCKEVQVGQVLINLLNNAFKEVQDQKNPWIKFQIEDRGDELEFSIMDSGRGIPQDIKEKIFDPFFTTRKQGEGTGLGLSVSSSLMSQQGSQLILDEECSNTRFYFRLKKIVVA